MLVLYFLFTNLIYPLVFLSALLNKKAKAFLERRKTDKKRIRELSFPNQSASSNLSKLGDPPERVIWLHAASVGELDQCKSQAKIIKEKEPKTIIIQSVYSESVQEKNYDLENTFFTFRLPLDFYFAYDFIFQKFRPEMLILMAWDTWPHLIIAANRYNCKVYLASAVLDPKSKRNSFFAKSMTKSIFSRLSGIATVSESMIPAFQELAGEKVKITSCGDSRFDSVVDKILSKKPNEGFTQFADAYPFKKIFLLASTYSQCDEIIIPTLNKILEMGYAIWIFPHKIDSSRIREISDSLRHSNLPFSVYSEVKNPCKDRIILFDALGILAFAYFYGNLAYVGGALHNKVHNILEPAYFGLPLITGDKIFNSFDALQLREQKSLTVITTSEEFLKAVQNFSDSLIRENVGISNKKYVTSHTGASADFYNTFIKQ